MSSMELNSWYMLCGTSEHTSFADSIVCKRKLGADYTEFAYIGTFVTNSHNVTGFCINLLMVYISCVQPFRAKAPVAISVNPDGPITV